MYKELAYYDGTYGKPEEIMVPFYDRTHFFGDGVYDATIGGNHKVYQLDEHVNRFFNSAKLMDINIPLTKEELKSLLSSLIKEVEGDTHFVYWQCSRGVTPRYHTYDADLKGKLWVFIRPLKLRDLNVPMKLTHCQDKRYMYCNAKTLNLMPSVLYAQLTKERNVDEIVLHRDDIVTECAHSNICILKDGIFYSHPDDEYILPGIGKAHLIKACQKLGIEVKEECFTLNDLINADEIIVSDSANFCCHCDKLDDISIGGKDQKTLNLIRSVVCKEYEEFLKQGE